MKLKPYLGTDSCPYWQKLIVPSVASLSFAVLLTAPSLTLANNNNSTLNCDVVIIGGGPGGVHTAFRLGTIPNGVGVDKTKVCLFEKENRLGGRVEDVAVGKNGSKMPTGAMRAPDGHYTVSLMRELGITMEDQLSRMTLVGIKNPNGVNAGTVFKNGMTGFCSYYGLTGNNCIDDFQTPQLLICGKEVGKQLVGTKDITDDDDNVLETQNLYSPVFNKNLVSGKNINQYGTQIVGDRVWRLYRDTNAFKADFYPASGQKEIDALSYLEYLANDWETDVVHYPINGFSEAIDKMADEAQAGGVKFYMNEAVQSIDKQNGSSPYKLKTSKGKTVNAKRVIIATDVAQLADINGQIIKDITKQDEYAAAHDAGAIATTITNQWDIEWWNQLDNNNVQFASHPNDPVTPIDDLGDDDPTNDVVATDGKSPQIRRGSMEGVTWGGGYCLTNSELANIPHWTDVTMSTRSAYIDEPDCAAKWWNLYQNSGVSAVNAKLMEGLKILYPRVFDPAKNAAFRAKNGGKTPKVLNTAVTHHSFAWNALAQGSYKLPYSKLTNESVWEWSMQPLANEKVYLVGDGWSVSNGWSASAYMSSIRVLVKKFGMTGIPLHDDDPDNYVTLSEDGTYVIFPRINCICPEGTNKNCVISWAYSAGDSAPNTPKKPWKKHWKNFSWFKKHIWKWW